MNTEDAVLYVNKKTGDKQKMTPLQFSLLTEKNRKGWKMQKPDSEAEEGKEAEQGPSNDTLLTINKSLEQQIAELKNQLAAKGVDTSSDSQSKTTGQGATAGEAKEAPEQAGNASKPASTTAAKADSKPSETPATK